MAEHIREVIVTIEVDTNKQTYRARLIIQDDETLEAFGESVVQKLAELTETA